MSVGGKGNGVDKVLTGLRKRGIIIFRSEGLTNSGGCDDPDACPPQFGCLVAKVIGQKATIRRSKSDDTRRSSKV
jgi:hypothetical protein